MSNTVFLILSPLALAMLGLVALVAWRRRAAAGAPALGAVAGLGAWWLLCSVGVQLAPTAELSALAARLAYLAIPWMSLAWLAFALGLTGRRERLWSWPLRALAAVAFVTSTLAMAMAHHDLIWASVETYETGPYRGVRVTYGPWFWVNAAVSWGASIYGTFLILRTYARSLKTYRQLSAWVAFGALAPLVVNAVWVFRLLPIEKDFSPLSFAVAAGALAYGLFRFRLLDVQPVARGVLVEAMTEALVVVDSFGRVTDFNPALERIAGGPIEPGVALVDAVPVLAPVLMGEVGEVTIETRDGTREFDWRATPLRAPARRGRTGARLVLLRDVTKRREAEAALTEALAELRTRNEDLDAFARTVAHDLKSPIGTIKGFVELMQDEGDALSPELREDGLRAIGRTAEKMHAIVQELLLLAGVRNQVVTPRPVDMGAIVGEALERLGPLVREYGARVQAPEAWPAAVGYGPWLEEVWVNYLSNAVKYGGRPPQIALGADACADGHVRFWVQDNGPGLSPEAQAAVFMPFERLHQDRGEGHGLGLSVVRQVMDKLGGTYGVESTVGEGSRFYFTLPCPPGSVAAAPLEALLAA